MLLVITSCTLTLALHTFLLLILLLCNSGYPFVEFVILLDISSVPNSQHYSWRTHVEQDWFPIFENLDWLPCFKTLGLFSTIICLLESLNKLMFGDVA
jgi:hypothetical protein